MWTHNVLSRRETFRLKQTLQWGITVRPHPLQRGRPLKFGMLWQRPRKDISRVFGPVLLRSTYPLHTLTMEMISIMRYSLDLKSLLNLVHPIQPLTLLNSNYFYFVHRLTAILMNSLPRTWQLKNCKKLSHARSKLRSKLSGFIGGMHPFLRC